ncbi:hypothetical protein T492DRAFT_382003 [Pavlovales sp. CCMP2436]|nr:hypothetical protein T492DRAFT_382003 [Pavlovales sp. CCMP2436]
MVQIRTILPQADEMPPPPPPVASGSSRGSHGRQGDAAAPEESALQLAVESLVLSAGNAEDEDDAGLRELRARWLVERARLLEQQARVDELARDYATRRTQCQKEREATRASHASAAERQVRELQEEVRHYRSLHSSPSTTPINTARELTPPVGSTRGAAGFGRRSSHSAPTTERSVPSIAPITSVGRVSNSSLTPLNVGVNSGGASGAEGGGALPVGPSGIVRVRADTGDSGSIRGVSGKAGELRQTTAAAAIGHKRS